MDGEAMITEKLYYYIATIRTIPRYDFFTNNVMNTRTNR